MPQNKTIAQQLRYLLMSVTLLWALMLNGQEVRAYVLPADNTEKQEKPRVTDVPSPEAKTVVKQKVSLEATTSFITLNLQQATLPASFPAFAALTDEVLPAQTALPSGNGFVAQLFPTTIQPNAP
ncbi:RNA methyltransferase [Pontibacter pudoricolor]|uniref:RNA methyltransferase n=1 Tax=Pontibacter pudoricolor TaxID=2694930 RepID=UPI001EE485FA|nr:RNA methyltransferase [Pontibacter pudoricolor]